jgi:hypothetical protein
MTAPAVLAQTLADNFMADVTVANGAPVALAHAYSGERKSYSWQEGPIAIVKLGQHGIDEKRFAVAKKRITYHSAVDLAWVNPDVDDSATDHVKPSDDYLSLLEAMKGSLRIHTSLGGRVLKCAEDDITIEPVIFVPANVPHWETTLRFDVLDEISAAPTG